MPANSPLIDLLKALSHQEPTKLARWRETIQDLLDEGVVDASVGTIALAFEEIDSGS
ncbi:hypothetical protein LCGC14_2766590 [marine sediment metagenome]|uniref:Methylmalonyl-CoA mutase domain-containing protein n=1 Tax=marine sediment metagenome TaxID=412755 RepID=A0A0F8YXG5_9ZZZZ